MSYEEEKLRLKEKAIRFLSGKNYVNADTEKNHLNLTYFNEKIDTEIEDIELFDEVDGSVNVYVRSHSEEYPEGYDLTPLEEFDNDEMKEILDLFGIKY